MNRLFLGSVSFFGLAAAGVALAVGWKLGSYLVDVCLDEETRDPLFRRNGKCLRGREGTSLVEETLFPGL